MRIIARGYVYWTNINRDIEETVRHCCNCQEASKLQNPRVIVSDNGPQFTTTEFQQFCRKQGLEHVHSPPFHPQSNGQAERFVDILIKEGGTTEKLAEFLQCYRRTPSTPVPGSFSPAEILLGRQIRTSLTLLKEPTKEKGTRNEKMKSSLTVTMKDSKGRTRWESPCGFETVAPTRGLDPSSSDEAQRYDDSGSPFPEEDRRIYNNEGKKINDDCTAEDQVAVPAEPSPRTTRPARFVDRQTTANRFKDVD
ncbi:hypothetical protein OESDEN_16413, partial [Oesophagostomum dentatum]